MQVITLNADTVIDDKLYRQGEVVQVSDDWTLNIDHVISSPEAVQAQVETVQTVVDTIKTEQVDQVAEIQAAQAEVAQPVSPEQPMKGVDNGPAKQVS